jgi:hypothetical protein
LQWTGLPSDERNALIYQQNSHRPLQEVVEEGHRTYAELLEASQSLSDEDLSDPRRFKNMPEDWSPWQVFTENSCTHYPDHLPDLRAWVNGG